MRASIETAFVAPKDLPESAQVTPRLSVVVPKANLLGKGVAIDALSPNNRTFC